MKNAILLCCLTMEAWAQGNARATLRMEPPAPPAQPRRFHSPRIHGVFIGATLPEHSPAPTPLPPAREAPRYLINKEFVPELLSPRTSVLPDTVLPPAGAPPPLEPMAVCHLKMKDGEEIEGTSCWLREDVIGYVNRRGRTVRVSVDLVEQGPSSERPPTLR